MRTLLGRRAWLLAALLLAAGAAVAPATAKETARTFVGRVAGAEASEAWIVVLVSSSGDVVAYACSQDDGWNQQHSRWFRGKLLDSGQLAADPDVAAGLSGSLRDQRFEGRLGPYAWTADLVNDGTAGVYRGRAGDEQHEVIETPLGTRIGRIWSVETSRVVGTWDFSSARVERAGDGLSVQRGGEAIVLERLVP
jgi:hypothetical protein